MTRPSLLVLALLSLLPACASHKPATDMNPQVSINTTLDTFHAAASQSDYARYFASWTAQSVFLGTDASERWIGDSFKDFARPYFEKGQGWTYLPLQRCISVSADGNTAWFDELLDNEKYGECRGSGVLLRNGEGAGGGGWVIVQYNLSFPIPNDIAADVTAKIKAFKAGRK